MVYSLGIVDGDKHQPRVDKISKIGEHKIVGMLTTTPFPKLELLDVDPNINIKFFDDLFVVIPSTTFSKKIYGMLYRYVYDITVTVDHEPGAFFVIPDDDRPLYM